MLDAVGVGHAAVLRSAGEIAIGHPVYDMAAGRLTFLSLRRVLARLGCSASAI